MPISSEDQFVRDLQARLPQAFAHLYEAYSPALLDVLVRLVKDQELAQDLLQEVFVKIWSNIHQYRQEHGRLYSWLITLTRHIAFDALRDQKTQQTYLLLIGPQLLHQTHWPSVDGHLMETLLDQLRPSYRVVMELAYLQDYTQVEIAEQLGLPLGTVKSRIRLALLQLRHYCRQDMALLDND